jgi:prevent-host-death family protein
MVATLSPMERTISASQFKAQCLALLDEVAESGEEIVVTKHGKAVARLAPIAPPTSLKGSVTYLVSDEELIAPFHDDWDPQFP